MRSDMVYLRMTKSGGYCLSSAEDRNLRVQGRDIPNGPDAPQAIAAALADHWQKWMRQADASVRSHPINE